MYIDIHRGITGPGDALPVAMTVDALGNMFAPDENYVLHVDKGSEWILSVARHRDPMADPVGMLRNAEIDLD